MKHRTNSCTQRIHNHNLLQITTTTTEVEDMVVDLITEDEEGQGSMIGTMIGIKTDTKILSTCPKSNVFGVTRWVTSRLYVLIAYSSYR